MGRRKIGLRLWALLAALASCFLTLDGFGQAASTLALQSADFQILSPADGHPIGGLHYDEHRDRLGVITLTGVARYADGQHDTEHDVFVKEADPAAPLRMFSFAHEFSRADGSLMLSASANFSTGAAVCIDGRGGTSEVASKKLDFPPDTYAGAGVILNLQRALSGGASSTIRFHAFSCASGPQIFAVQAEALTAKTWAYFPGDLTRIDVKPDFGWLSYVIAPFVPKMNAWFAPTSSGTIRFVGGEYARYYKGPVIILKLATDASPQSSSGASPAKSSNVN
jgi:hypothetical protein